MAINYSNLENISKNLSNFQNSQLLIVTKNQTFEDCKSLLQSGYRLFGENRVQEAEKKFFSLRGEFKFNLHLIGPLQSNKVKTALKTFDCIQTIDRKKIVDELLKFRNFFDEKKTFYIQINIGEEIQKSGVLTKDFHDLYKYCLNTNLPIEGIMCIPPNFSKVDYYFQEMAAIKKNTNPSLKLSMGMSNDYLQALKMGSDLVRIGSKIFI